MNALSAHWHIECLHCQHRYYYSDQHQIVHNAGYDWEDSSSFCPECGLPQECSTDYAMHDGRIPA